jgi:hypothetical protein
MQITRPTQSRASQGLGAYSKGEGLQGIFELAILWAVVLAVPIGLALGIETLLDAAFPLGRAGVHTIISLGVGLLAAIAIISSGDTEQGGRVGRALGGLIHDYAFHIALMAGFAVGWLYRSEYVPDPERARAERAAWKACGTIPECIERATDGNEGNDVTYYIAAPAAFGR